MSDYLSRAVERETSAAPAVRPALPSLFDPGKTSAIVTELAPERPSEDEPSRSARPETKAEISPVHEALTAVNALWTDVPSAAPEQPGTLERAARKTSPGMADKPVAPSIATVVSTESSPSKQPQSPDRSAIEQVMRPSAQMPSTPPRAPVETVEGRPTQMPPKPLHAMAEPDVGSTTEMPRVTAKSVVKVAQSPAGEPRAVPAIGAPAVPAIDAPASTPQTAPAARPALERTEAKSGKPPATMPFARVVVPAHATIPRIPPAPLGPELARSSDNTASPRAVHITIGRIEVRAVHPPPEPIRQRPAPPAPKISLEEYLKQRNGNRR